MFIYLFSYSLSLSIVILLYNNLIPQSIISFPVHPEIDEGGSFAAPFIQLSFDPVCIWPIPPGDYMTPALQASLENLCSGGYFGLFMPSTAPHRPGYGS